MNWLRKQIAKILSEAVKDEHYIERLYDRLIKPNEVEVGFENENSVGIYTAVGTYVIPTLIKQQIIENIKLIEEYNFPKRKSFGIQIAFIPVDKTKVKYFSEDLKNISKSQTLVLVDEKTGSNGNLVYAIVRDNVLTTIYFAKSYVAQDKIKLNVDAIVKNMSVIKNKTLY